MKPHPVLSKVARPFSLSLTLLSHLAGVLLGLALFLIGMGLLMSVLGAHVGLALMALGFLLIVRSALKA